MKTIIISKLPSVISEKDLFLILHTITPGLKRIIIADDADLEGRTKNMALAVYSCKNNKLNKLYTKNIYNSKEKKLKY
jgi:hypothetical protein